MTAWGLLVHVEEHGRVAPSQLAAETGVTATTIRDQVQSLVDRGLVDRVPNPDDNRSYLLRLTGRHGEGGGNAGARAGQATRRDATMTAVRIAPTFAPALPVHGKRLAVVGGKTCAARIGTTRLRGRCAWTVPATAKGKTLVVTVDARAYRFRVR